MPVGGPKGSPSSANFVPTGSTIANKDATQPSRLNSRNPAPKPSLRTFMNARKSGGPYCNCVKESSKHPENSRCHKAWDAHAGRHKPSSNGPNVSKVRGIRLHKAVTTAASRIAKIQPQNGPDTRAATPKLNTPGECGRMLPNDAHAIRILAINTKVAVITSPRTYETEEYICA